MRGMIYRT